MHASDVCIYGYLSILAFCAVIYGVIVVFYGGIDQQPIRVDVGLPLDVIINPAITSSLHQLDNITNGVSIDIWWGLVETEPMFYNWTEYEALFLEVQTSMPKARVKAILNFHGCNKDFFCNTNITLPSWILSMGDNNTNLFYMDVSGNTNYEYLTSGVDHMNIFQPSNRTALQMYSDFVNSFAQTFTESFDSLIYEVQVGLGPAGELRYPAFPADRWRIPGVGQFQCYDSYLRKEYATYAAKTGAAYSLLPTLNAVSYNDTPGSAPFFNRPKINGSTSAYGDFFLSWYSSRLLQHGQVILSQVSSVLRTHSPNVTLSTKLGCIYWQNGDPSHAAEVTAGYMNYTIIAEMLQNLNVRVVFGCFDLSDRQASLNLVDAHAAPQQLVSELLQTAETVGLKVEGTNSLPFGTSDLALIVSNARHNPIPLVGFTYNYLSSAILDDIKDFRHFVDQLNATNTK